MVSETIINPNHSTISTSITIDENGCETHDILYGYNYNSKKLDIFRIVDPVLTLALGFMIGII